MILFFDTETTGFTRPNKPADHPDQPHLTQIAAQLVRPDNTTFMEFSFVVNAGVPIPKQASDVHGITNEIAEVFGVSQETAVDFFLKLYGHADKVVAHNCNFDKQVMASAIARRMQGAAFDFTTPFYCTMKNATDIVKAPPTPKMLAAGRAHWKSPNLGECIQHFFGEELSGAHDAMVDVQACRRVYFELNKAA